MMFGPVDAWRYRLPCRRCGAACVTTLAHAGAAYCAVCLREAHGAPVVVRANLDPAARLGQGGARLDFGGRYGPTDAECRPVAPGPIVLDVETTDRAGARLFGGRTLVEPAQRAGWTVRVTRSAAVLSPVVYAASNKEKRGQVRAPAAVVDVVCLRVARPGAIGYGTWRDGKWNGGAGVRSDGFDVVLVDGPKPPEGDPVRHPVQREGCWFRFGTVESLKRWLGIG